MTTLEIIEKNGLCAMDNICVFCSHTMDGWDRVCRSCNEYKGVMSITDAINIYGEEILGL